MPTTDGPTLMTSLGRGALSGVAGTAAMTAFQKAVEMPLTGRGDSYAPAKFLETVLPIRRRRGRARDRVNYAGHFGIGVAWGAAHGFAGHRGLSGQRAVATVFGVVYTGDLLLNTALGLYKPWRWSRRDTAIDVIDKLVLAQATGAAYEALRPTAKGAAPAAVAA